MRAPSDGGISSGAPGSTLDTIFDGIDISVPTAPAKVSDPALDAGDFMIDVAPAPAAPPPTGDGEWASSSALGADLLAAFNNASDPTESEIEVGGGIDISMDAGPGLPPPPPGPDPVVQFSAPAPTPMPSSLPLVDRLHMLAQRLRSQGRTDDADVVTEAMAHIKLQG